VTVLIACALGSLECSYLNAAGAFIGHMLALWHTTGGCFERPGPCTAKASVPQHSSQQRETLH
jgi:hypothetical protein